MARPNARIRVLELLMALGLGVVVLRAAQLQLVRGGRYAEVAANQRTETVVLPAWRGTIFDRNGEALAITQEYYALGIAPKELRDPDSTARLLSRRLDIPVQRVRRDLHSGRGWVFYGGRYTASQINPLRKMRGVYPEPHLLRFRPSAALASAIVGAVDVDGAGASGIELSLDTLLAGQPGEAALLRDSRGRRYDSPARRTAEPVSGHNVYLTLDAELQDIAERGLADALEGEDAASGDVVFLDVASGEILALASGRRDGQSTGASALTTTFEPGSTAKLFTAAALLEHTDIDSTVKENGENGVYRMPMVEHPTSPSQYRTITDVHREPGDLNLAGAIQVSSNIVMSKLAQRLTSAQQFSTLRDFGFGAPTGVGFPSESRGVVKPLDEWLPGVSRASVAMGYEFSVTPLQLALAYSAIANEGILLAPALVREIRDPTGETIYRHHPEPVRRAVSDKIAGRLMDFLRGAVSGAGTGGRAQLMNYQLAGKTGTARINENGRYIDAHVASFAALFPADDPQLAIIVKIDRPARGYYGGATAAPVTRAMLNEALAAKRVALDRSRLAHRPNAVASAPRPPPAEPRDTVIGVPWPPPDQPDKPASAVVPEVIGRPLRTAVRALHAQGFRVSLKGKGNVVFRVWPAEGAKATTGSAVTVWTR